MSDLKKRSNKDIEAIYTDIVGHFKLIYRPSQLHLIQRIYNSFFESHVVNFNESPTGTGKSFSYLIPAIIFCYDNQTEKIVLSTKTLTLQDQIISKDVPRLLKYFKDRLEWEILVAVQKGRSNYICGYRALIENEDVLTEDQVTFIKTNLDNSVVEIDKYDFEKKINKKINTLDSGECLKKSCRYYESKECGIFVSKQKSKDANIIIVNTYLLFSDMWVRHIVQTQLDDPVIPISTFSNIIIDEAHLLEDIASSAFTRNFTREMFHEAMYTLRNKHGIVNRKLEDDVNDSVERLIKHTNSAETDAIPLNTTGPTNNAIQALVKYCDFLSEATDTMGDGLGSATKAKITNTKRLFMEYVGLLGMILKPNTNYVVYREHNVIKFTLINYAKVLQEVLFSCKPTINMVSATLSYDKKFFYTMRSLFLETAKPPFKLDGIVYPPIFDKDKVEYIIPDHMVDYRDPDYENSLADMCYTSIVENKGSALLLFTSIKRMENVYAVLKKKKLPFTLLLQSATTPKMKLIEEFKQDIHSVLMGSYSFWEGIDVPGKSLTLIVIDKLPFEPRSVVNDAISEQFGGFQYSCFKATLKTKQGIGRLIRSEEDSGKIVICDPRLKTKYWGNIIMKNLNT